MGSYVLILTLMFWVNGGTNTSITTASFQTEAACMAAARLWLKETEGGRQEVKRSAICAWTGKT